MKAKFFTLLLSVLPLLVWGQSPNYEQQGDELYQQAKYEQAVKKYDAAMVTSETGSAQLRMKKENAKKCAALLQKAVSAESSKQYSEAEKAYTELFALHALPKYQKKAAECKGYVQKEALAKKERERNFVNGHFAVDMGLSVRWADCNVGASKSDDAGNYFAWGETRSKASYNRQTYKYYSNSTWVLKYCTMSDCGNVDNKLVLDSQDDAATVNWGEGWRTPTKEQWEELKNSNNCVWEWISIMRVPGYKVTSKITNNSIFLPVTGYKSVKGYLYGDMGLYWTSSLYPNIWNKSYGAAYRFDLKQTSFDLGRDSRHNGRAIRAVCK